MVTKHNSVAILGCIMPLPLAIAPTRTTFPPIMSSAANSFATVSVVIMARAALPAPSTLSPSASACIPPSIGSIGSICPITPVEATITSLAGIPVYSLVRAHIRSAFSTPSALQVLALPLLQITARALPFSRFFFVTAMGAPFTLLVV